MKIQYQNNIYTSLLKELKKAILGSKFENHVFLVGGAVRDAILGKEIKDIDLCVDLPNGGIEFAEWVCNEYGCHKKDSNPCVFPKYGTAKFTLSTINEFSKIPIECVQTRKEQYHSESRNPETCFGDIESDANRRDLTINALYVNICNDEILDPTKKGLDDITKHILRTPSSPDIVFNDDPLRILRVIRFSSTLGWGIEKDTWFGIIQHTKRIGIISQERITSELGKILLSPKPSVGFLKMLNCGLLDEVLPEISLLNNVKQGVQHFGNVFVHTMAALDASVCEPLTRWAVLMHDVGKFDTQTFSVDRIHFYRHDEVGSLIAANILKRLKLPNNDIGKITTSIKEHMRFKSVGDKLPSKKNIKRFIATVGLDNVDLTLNVIDADNKSHSISYCMPNQVRLIREAIPKILNEVNNVVKLPINGSEVMQHFNLKQSPKIGELLKALKDKIIDSDQELTKDDCLAFLSEIIKKGEN